MRVLISALLIVLAAGASASAGTLDRVRESGTLTIGYRTDAAPFAYHDEQGEPAGFMINLCRSVVASLEHQLDLADIAIDYVPVTAENRFDAIAEGRIDMLCGATTATLTRREHVDFSILVFIDGASVLYRADGPADFDSLAGHKIGVRAATTTETALRNTLKVRGIAAEVVAVSSHDEGLSQLESNDISAYFADQAILLYMWARSQSATKLRLSKHLFTNEPYALALPRGDDDFRLVVDRALSRIYRTGTIWTIFSSSFASVQPSDLLKALYVTNALPE